MAQLGWLNAALAAAAKELGERSGSLFYTARSAFERKRPLYILGLISGGSPLRQPGETVARDLAD